MSPVEVLKKYWGYESFRPLQEDIVHSLTSGKDTLALLPTGGGKSICFQVPALMLPGVCLVVSPLIALMKDQVENLRKIGVSSIYLHSGMSAREMSVALENMANGAYKLIYLSPERLQSEAFLNFSRATKFSFIAIDEAHCVSQWGFDFRPEYLRIREFREKYPKLPVMALTASATSDVMADIIEQLDLRDPAVFRKSFDRPNLNYIVLHEEAKDARLLKVIERIRGSGVIYSRNRRGTEEIARFLQSHKISADFYHAGLSSEDRNRKQESWTHGRTRLMVSTNAFGMGIDKADVRLVIHYEPSDSLESYYQEAGRAGRDGLEAWCVLIYGPTDHEDAVRRFLLQYPDFAVVEQIYNSICNYFSVAFGSGEGQSYDFDLEDFTLKFGLKPVTVMASLRLLEQMGYLKVSEGVYIPAKLRILVDNRTLYDFQVRSASLDDFIKAILRAYPGVFSQYTTIRTRDLAEKLQISRTEVEKNLKTLQERAIIDYLPSRDKPFVTMLRGRTSKLDVREGFVRQTKERALERLEKMLDYAEADRCRSRIIREYFGEKVDSDCGRCDHCRKKEAGRIKMEKTADRIEALLSVEELTPEELSDRLDDKGLERAYLSDLIRELLEKGQLDINTEGKLIWRENGS